MRSSTAFLFVPLLAGCSATVSVEHPDAAPPGPDATTVDAPPQIYPDAPPLALIMYAHSRDTLFTIDPNGFALATIGAFGVADNITDLAVTPDGTLYGISSTKLYVISRETAAATYVADVPGVDNVGLTFLPDGTLLATDAPGGVRQIDPELGTVTEIGAFGGGYATAGDLVAVADGTMYAISDQGPVGDEYDNNVLLTVNTATGVAAPVGQIGFGQVFGAAYANGHVYAFTADGHLIEIDRATGAGVEVRAYGLEFWGAGVTPLVPVVQ
jgi:outer membrane protein assembly factor BamB